MLISTDDNCASVKLPIDTADRLEKDKAITDDLINNLTFIA